MEFRTTIPVSPSSIRIDHRNPVLTLGSCFANVIGNKLQESKIPSMVNPFGVIFNPLSIFKTIDSSIDNVSYFENSYLQNNGIWYNYDLHSDFSNTDKAELSERIYQQIIKVNEFLQSTRVITLTFGTAFVYRLINSNEIVANCHKVPASQFRKELLSPEQILHGFEKFYNRLSRPFPSISIILTVSPVRHIKDGIEENSISKSILRLVCHLIQQKFPNVDYFPSYEIMMDDLRDYRFYGKDMIHPSEVAEEYIWEKFQKRYMAESTITLIQDWKKIRKALQHKPFHPESEGHKKFLSETLSNLKRLNALIDLKEEIEVVEQKLNELKK